MSSLSASLAYPGLANESARPITRSLAAVAILTVILLGRALPRAAPLDADDEYAFWLKKHHSSLRTHRFVSCVGAGMASSY